MRDVSADLVTFLAAAGLDLASGVNLFAGPVREVEEGDGFVPGPAVFVLQTGGTVEPYVAARRTVRRDVTVQVKVRGPREDFEGGQAWASSVLSALTVADVPGYSSVCATDGAPFYGGSDGSDRHWWSFSVDATFEEAP